MRGLGLAILVAVGAFAVPVVAQDTAAPDPAALSAKIDAAVDARLTKEDVPPAGASTDSEFFRRAWLDIAGKTPPVADVRAFLADTDPDKRRKLVDSLLESPNYVTHFTTVWRTTMMPEVDADFQVRFLIPGFEAWLRQKFTEDAKYSDIVREILTQPLSSQNARNPYQPSSTLQPIGFYQAKQLKPENLAGSTARIFLGVRIECAQCHDHPFDKWKQEEFWSYAAFFGGIERQAGGQGVVGAIQEFFDRKEIEIPGKGVKVKPAYLDGTEPRLYKGGPRATLADWVLDDGNPYFARAAVNRMWAHFFGLGIVHPVDDFTSQNPASHPELLDELAKDFIASGYDLKFLIRAIAGSKAYQRTSEQTDSRQADERLFAKLPVKGLTPEQLFDSLAQATGYYRPFNSQEMFQMQGNTPREEFLDLFAAGTESPTERPTTILQALAVMNGQFVADQTSLDRSALLSAVADFPLMTTPERIEALYMAALSRPPRPGELERLTRYVESGGAANDPRKALSDVFWAMLNSSEFLFNH